MQGRLVLLLIIAVWFIIPNLQAQANQQLVVFAAASLIDAFEEIATKFEAQNPTVDVLYNFSGSSTLATQINQGAPADVFASANFSQMQRVVDEGLVMGESEVFIHNRLTVLVPLDNPAKIQSIDDLANAGISLVLAAPAVPIRDYTDTLFEELRADPNYGDQFVRAVISNVVSEEPNVRQVVAKIAFGEADAGIVYTSDVTPDIEADVIAIPIDDTFNAVAQYPIAILEGTTQPQLAQDYIDFILSDEGQAILQTWDFTPIPNIITDKPCILLCLFEHK